MFDLPIALGLLLGSGQVAFDHPETIPSSVGRLITAAWRSAKKSSCQPEGVAAVTPSSRGTSSRSSM